MVVCKSIVFCFFFTWFQTPTGGGDRMPEILSSEERARAIADMMELRKQYPKLDMPAPYPAVRFNAPQPPGLCFCAHRPRRCRQTFKQISLRASSAEILIAHLRVHGLHGMASIAAHKIGRNSFGRGFFKASVRIARTE